jgi:hypothetical protein
MILQDTRSADRQVLARATRHHIAESGILYRQRRGNLKSQLKSCLAFMFPASEALYRGLHKSGDKN